MKKIFYQKKYIVLDIIGIVLVIGLISWYFLSKDTVSKRVSRVAKTWQTVEVETAKDFASIKVPAKVHSNQFAVIAPRRVGIIQDLLVDIGDTVYKGQTIGSMLPQGVEGQSSASINEASARLQKARAELANAKGVAVDSVSVATKQWRETNLQSQTQSTLDQESQKQLAEKKAEAALVATQAWESTKLVLFGTGSNTTTRNVQGRFANSVQKNDVENLADEIQQMEASGIWNTPEKIVEHISHLENFLVQAEILYKNAQEGNGLSVSDIGTNLTTIQRQQLNLSQIKQSLLALEEKSKQFSSLQAEREAGVERSKEVLELVQSQQDLSVTQAQKNVEVALANYNTALVRSGHQTITSPFSGIITARMVEVGQAVTPNTMLFYLEAVDTARSQQTLQEIHFNLPESWKNKITVGDTVSVTTMDGESIDGHIFRLSPQISLQTNSIVATAIIPPSDSEKGGSINFWHGQSVFVSIIDSKSSVFTVPTLSLKKRRNTYFLWKMEEDIPVQIEGKVVAEDGEFSQVFSRELMEGDSIISNPSVSLFKQSK